VASMLSKHLSVGTSMACRTCRSRHSRLSLCMSVVVELLTSRLRGTKDENSRRPSDIAGAGSELLSGSAGMDCASGPIDTGRSTVLGLRGRVVRGKSSLAALVAHTATFASCMTHATSLLLSATSSGVAGAVLVLDDGDKPAVAPSDGAGIAARSSEASPLLDSELANSSKIGTPSW